MRNIFTFGNDASLPMKQLISVADYFQNFIHLPVIDVRSPGEFAQGHIPNAINVALFSDEERAIVGTSYKKVSKESAITAGYKFVTPKLNHFSSASLAIAPQKEVIVHCWRGGMRSNAFADHLTANGFDKVYLMENGYKAFRNYVLKFLKQPFNLKILGGYTGTGKTEILHHLQLKGQQIIDLEALANHRGSAFGGIDLPPQPTTEQFENKLFMALQNLNASLPIWIEDESQAIGKVAIPNAFFLNLRNQPVYFLNVPLAQRTKHLVATYATLNHAKLADAIVRITKRLGYDNAKFALAALENKDYDKVVTLTLSYYDKYYLRGLEKRTAATILPVEILEIEPEATANFLIGLIN